jgi:O-antigen ligase
VLETGSRTGMLILLAISLFLLPRYAREHKATVALAVVAVFLVFSAVSPGNIRRLKTIPKSLAAAFSGEVKHREQLDQDEESAQTRQLKNKDTWALIKAHPVFGVGIDPNEQLFLDKYPNAGGQVHCEILMAGKQMGFIGMGLYLGLVGTLILRGRTIHRQLSERWPDMANLGWTLKMQGITILVGGAFSPLPWNPVLMLLAGSASALWGDLSANEEVPEIE